MRRRADGEQAFGKVRLTSAEKEGYLWATFEVLCPDWGFRDGVRVCACVCVCAWMWRGDCVALQLSEQQGLGKLRYPPAPAVPRPVPLLQGVRPVSA